jgi:hypothetical protein
MDMCSYGVLPFTQYELEILVIILCTIIMLLVNL